MGHAIVGGLAGGIGGATGAAASSLTGTDINNVLLALGLPQGVADGLTVAITAGIGAATGGRTGAAGATNEVLNNALLSKATIDALVQQGGWETIRACLASPNCVNLIGSETAAKLYVALNVTDAIEAATRGMPNITKPSANETNYQGVGGAVGAQELFNSLPIEPESKETRPTGVQVATLVDGYAISLYTARSTKEASVQIVRPGSIGIKVRF